MFPTDERGTDGRARTDTIDPLRAVPLPFGLRQHEGRHGESNPLVLAYDASAPPWSDAGVVAAARFERALATV